jgi:hypothetical protein
MSPKESAMRQTLESVRLWANDKIAAGEDPPWAWYQYMKLRETLDAILQGMNAATTARSPQSDEHQERYLRLVEATYSPDSAPRPSDGSPVKLPM